MKKYLIKIFSIFFTFVLMTSTCVNVFAVENDALSIDRIIEKENSIKNNYEDQMNEIMTGLVEEKGLYNDANSKYLQDSVDIVASYDLENAYCVRILEPLLLTALNETGTFESAITDTIQWKIPITTTKGESGLAVLVEENGELIFAGLVVGETTGIWNIKTDNIKKAVVNYSNTISAEKMMSDSSANPHDIEKKISSMEIVHSYLYNTSFVYIKASGSEYLIPYSMYANDIGIENNQLYSLAEITEKFNACFDEQQLIDNPMSNGGVPFRQDADILRDTDIVQGTYISYVTIVIVVCLLTAIIIITIYVNKKRMRNGKM